MMTTTAISGAGELAAFLWDVTPDSTPNNRTGILVLVDGATGKEAYRVEMRGQGPKDPQSVAMSTSADEQGKFTVAAILGSANKVIEYDPAARRAKELWSKAGLEVDIAVSKRGEAFAVTSGVGKSVDVYGRSSTDEFALLANIPAPNFQVQPVAIAFDRANSAAAFFCVAWTDSEGTQVTVTAHEIEDTKTVKQIWSYSPQCPGGSN